MKEEFKRMYIGLSSLVVFSGLLKDPVISGIHDLLGMLCSDEDVRDITETKQAAGLVEKYAGILAKLYTSTSDLSEYIKQLVITDDNFYVEAIARDEEIDEEIFASANRELDFLEELSALSSETIKDALGSCDPLPSWGNHPLDLKRDFANKLKNLSLTGYGIFEKHAFFRMDGSRIVPVPYPDVQPLSELFGYERQRDMIIQNTKALLDGKGASNMLLYGDAGTGKSSTIKAVAAEFASTGLRLIEIKKDQLSKLADIIEVTSRQPLSFILFVDDLSFYEKDDNFSALKATLEGSISGHNLRTAIYATSNRRHLVRESFSDRNGDDLHLNDTLQETMSLAARFGLSILFERPDKEEYLNIVKELAELNDLNISQDRLFAGAESHAIRRNGRSPRTAKQYIDLLRTGLDGQNR